MVMQNSSNSSAKSGNTKQISPSKHWCFTLNNYTKQDIKDILEVLSSNSYNKYVFQEEIGESKTPHLQGYIGFAKKVRPFNIFKQKRIHWEKTRNIKSSIKYCMKDDDRIIGTDIYSNIKFPKPLKVITHLYKWQEEVVKWIEDEPDDRSIVWIYERDGNVGKTALIKKLCVENGGLMISGKANDMKYAIAERVKKSKEVPLILINVPRSISSEYISYGGIEQIKDGIFFNNKYESDMVIYNSPHVIVFGNERPNTCKMSIDRWRIYRIENKELCREEEFYA